MKTKLKRWKLTFLYFFFIHTLSLGTPDAAANCVLNFTSFPYQPTGECIGAEEKINAWGSFPTTLCCRNALTSLSQALAQQARGGEGNIFLDEAKWRNCSRVMEPQKSVSMQSCGFEDLFNGSNSKCSALSLPNIAQDQTYKDASNKCSGFSNRTSSFDDTCINCITAVVEARGHLLDELKVSKNGREKAICGVAVVISIAAGWEYDHSSEEDFYRCLLALDVMEPGYIKIKGSVAKAVLAILIATIGLVLLIMLMKYVTKSTSTKQDDRKQRGSVKSKEMTTNWSSLYRFSKAEIENAINNISHEKEFLGHGSAGQVYKGVLPSGQVVAIKQIYKTNNSNSFSREVDNLLRVRHPNLVSLFGCCIEDGDQYLVYEYCAAGNLAQHLRGNSTLIWKTRVKILRDCALALRYLHHHIDGCIVHRDIKLTNILLTDKLEPKLSDFGLAKLLGMEESKVFTEIKGTIGYMDPEYMSNAKLGCPSDVYSFGIVVLQLLSGQKVLVLDLEARDQLTRMAKDVSMGKRPLTDFEDPRLKGNFNRVDFESILQIAVLCVASSSKGRPTIDVVFDEMDKAWKNTQNEEANKEMSSSATPEFTSGDVLRV